VAFGVYIRAYVNNYTTIFAHYTPMYADYKYFSTISHTCRLLGLSDKVWLTPGSWHPLLTTDVTDDSKAVQYEFVCDGTRYPTAPVATTPEAYTALVRLLRFAGQTSHSIAIGGKSYDTTDFVICEIFERIIGSALSGQIEGGKHAPSPSQTYGAFRNDSDGQNFENFHPRAV